MIEYSIASVCHMESVNKLCKSGLMSFLIYIIEDFAKPHKSVRHWIALGLWQNISVHITVL